MRLEDNSCISSEFLIKDAKNILNSEAQFSILLSEFIEKISIFRAGSIF